MRPVLREIRSSRQGMNPRKKTSFRQSLKPVPYYFVKTPTMILSNTSQAYHPTRRGSPGLRDNNSPPARFRHVLPPRRIDQQRDIYFSFFVQIRFTMNRFTNSQKTETPAALNGRSFCFALSAFALFYDINVMSMRFDLNANSITEDLRHGSFCY